MEMWKNEHFFSNQIFNLNNPVMAVDGSEPF